jgi:multimeric flavodoxin WrbA
MTTPKIVAVYGSPRRKGNSATLLRRAVEGAEASGAAVAEIVLRDLKMSPCLEIYGCKNAGECRLKDDFQKARDQILASQGLILATPVFFYTVSAHTKILMDRFQSLWVKKYWIDTPRSDQKKPHRKGLLISVGATKGKRLFDGMLLSIKYFFDVIDMELWKSLLYRGLDHEGDVLNFTEYLDEAYQTGKEFAQALKDESAI